MIRDADVLVLGGGPGGSAAAITAARVGLRVVLLEREPGPRHRPGETLHPGVEPILERLGIDLGSFAGCVRHGGTWVSWGAAERFVPFGHDERGAWLGYQVRRADLDWKLLAAAADAGVDVRRGVAAADAIVERERVVGIGTASGALRGRIVIDATGGGHRIAHQLGIPVVARSQPLLARYGYVRGRCEGRDAAPRIASDHDGWTWTARVAPGSYHWTRLDVGAAQRSRTWRPDELASLEDDGPVRGADVTWRRVHRAAVPGAFFVGDAGCVLDPASSHGVLRALMSGMMAGHCATRMLHDGVPEATVLHSYDEWLGAWFAADEAELRTLYASAGLNIVEPEEMASDTQSVQARARDAARARRSPAASSPSIS